MQKFKILMAALVSMALVSSPAFSLSKSNSHKAMGMKKSGALTVSAGGGKKGGLMVKSHSIKKSGAKVGTYQSLKK